MSLARRVIPGVSHRTDFELVGDKCGLLVVDVQKYLSQPRKDTATPNDSYFFNQASPKSIENIIKLVHAFRLVRDGNPQDYLLSKQSSLANPPASTGCEVVFTYLQSATQDGRDISLDYKLSGPDLANIPRFNTDFDDIFLETLQPDPLQGKGDLLLPKTSCNVFVSTNIDYLLRNLGVEQIVVVGQLTDECVESAVRTAADLGYLVTVVHDACASTTAAKHAKGLNGVKGFARILSTQDVLQEIMEGIMPPGATTATTADAKSNIPSAAAIAEHLNDEKVVTYLQRKGLHKVAKQLDMMFTIQSIAKGGSGGGESRKKTNTEEEDISPRSPRQRPKQKIKGGSGHQSHTSNDGPSNSSHKIKETELSDKVDVSVPKRNLQPKNMAETIPSPKLAPDPPSTGTNPPIHPKSPKAPKSDMPPPPLVPMKSPKRNKSKTKVIVDSREENGRVEQV